MKVWIVTACLIVSGVAFAQLAPYEGAKFTVTSTEIGRATPFFLPIADDVAVPSLLAQTDGGLHIPLSVVGDRLVGVLPANTPAGIHPFTIGLAAYKSVPAISLTAKDSDIEVHADGELVTTFHYKKDDRKPYLWPLKGEGGASLTRDYPFVEGGKTKDHPHHVSFWTAHGDINGADYWEYGERTGWQVVDKLDSGSGYAAGWITAANIWQDKDHTPVIFEERTYIFYHTPGSGRLLDVNVKFTAAYGDVTFGDTKEGGIVGLRMNDDLREQGGTGKITTSEGAVGEKAAWGKAAAWCDYTGTLEGFGARGITVMNHPSSFRYPIRWHVRAYGLLGANAFGYSDFTGGKENGEYTLKNGESIEFKFRIYLHSGDVEAADVAGYFKDYATPPVAEWVE